MEDLKSKIMLTFLVLTCTGMLKIDQLTGIMSLTNLPKAIPWSTQVRSVPFAFLRGALGRTVLHGLGLIILKKSFSNTYLRA